MVDVTLRPMTPDEYTAWYPRSISEYAEEHIKAGSMPADAAHEQAAKQFAELLPDGLDTTAHHLLVGDVDGVRVGVLWLNIPVGDSAGAAFVYDVEVDETERGHGYGRAIMLGAETYARERGAGVIKLHVFGSNTVARRLYESLGYEPTNIGMAKPLS